MELVIAMIGVSSGLLTAYLYFRLRLRAEGKRKRIYAEKAEAERQRLEDFIANQPGRLSPYQEGVVYGQFLDNDFEKLTKPTVVYRPSGYGQWYTGSGPYDVPVWVDPNDVRFIQYPHVSGQPTASGINPPPEPPGFTSHWH